MAMTSQWLGNLHYRSMATEPKWEMSSLKLMKNLSAWPPLGSVLMTGAMVRVHGRVWIEHNNTHE